MPKNIVVFSDGTGQEGGHGPNTNVYKLFNMIEDRSDRQIAFYDRGLGTGWRRVTGLAFGAGISHNIKECYEFIFENYQQDDRIYLFGFSRGAFTVRSLSGFIHLFGMLPKSRPELIKEAFNLYKGGMRWRGDDPERRREQAEDFLARHHTISVPIRFIGVWDTVAALGIPIRALDLMNPFPHRFHDADFVPSVEAGYHALSIDDPRRSFHPTVWQEASVPEGSTCEQIWFPGVHTDVGGGYPDAGLSDITLEWLVGHAEDHGLHLRAGHAVPTQPDPHGQMHDPCEGLGRFYRKKERSRPEGLHALKVHTSVPTRATAGGYDPWPLREAHKIV